MDSLVSIVVGWVGSSPLTIAVLFLLSEIIGVSSLKENSIVQVVLNIIRNILAALGKSVTPTKTTPTAPK
jgi:hypothetical protein